MMYVFICPDCGASRMVSLLRSLDCPVCAGHMANCELDYMDWIRLSKKQRDKLIHFYRQADKDKLCFLRPMPFYDRWERNYYY